MANNFQTPWVIDTASANTVKPGIAFVKGFLFQGYSTSTHKAVIKDARGSIVAELVGNAALSPVSLSYTSGATPIRDLAVTTLDSGKVIVDVE